MLKCECPCSVEEVFLIDRASARHRGVKVHVLLSVVSVVFGKWNALVIVTMVKLAEVKLAPDMILGWSSWRNKGRKHGPT